MDIFSAFLIIAASILILLGIIIAVAFIFTVIIATVLAIFEMDMVEPVVLTIAYIIIIACGVYFYYK